VDARIKWGSGLKFAIPPLLANAAGFDNDVEMSERR
jgi:hypothetical protein